MFPDPRRRPPLSLRRAPDRELQRAGSQLEAAGLVRGCSGNLSARVGDGMRITAAGARLGDLGRGTLVTTALEGTRDRGRKPSSEAGLHAAIYLARPDVGAIVHTHGAYSTACASTSDRLDLTLEEARYYSMGATIPVVPWVPAGSAELARVACEILGSGTAVLLAHHGALAVGPDIRSACDIAASLEHQAQVAWLLSDRRAAASVLRAPRRAAAHGAS